MHEIITQNNVNRQSKLSPEILSNCFAATSGLVRSQVLKLTGIEAPTLQNWIKRGWLLNPIDKKYTINHVARILIIKMLKDVLQLEKIARILTYVNGDPNDMSDNILTEFELYTYVYNVLYHIQTSDSISMASVSLYIEDCVKNYKEAYPGAKQRLIEALKIITIAFAAAKYKSYAENLIDTLEP